MKKCASLVIPMLLLICFCFSGCAVITEEKPFAKSGVSQITQKTNAHAGGYNVTYDLKKSKIFYSTTGGSNVEVDRMTYEVKGAKLKRGGSSPDYSYDYKGTLITQPNLASEKKSGKFHQYSEGENMYYYLDGKLEKTRELSSLAMSVDKLSSSFYNTASIERITEYTYSDGKKQYVFDYASDKSIFGGLFSNPGSSYYPSEDTILTPMLDKKGVPILHMFLFVDREGRITRQEVDLQVYIADEWVGGQKAKGELKYSLSVEYRW